MTTTDMPEQEDWMDLLRALIRFAEKVYTSLASTNPSPPQVHHACLWMGAVGIRRLKAAQHDILGGYGVESWSHARSALDVALDVGFLLAQGADRRRLAQRYIDFSIVKLPWYKELASDASYRARRLGQIQSRLWNHVRAAYEGTPLLEAEHWSGGKRREVVPVAIRWFDEQYGPEWAQNIRDITFKQLGSASVHCDPGLLGSLPWDKNKISLGPSSRGATVGAFNAVAAGLLLLCGLCKRTRRPEDWEELKTLVARFEELLKRTDDRYESER